MINITQHIKNYSSIDEANAESGVGVLCYVSDIDCYYLTGALKRSAVPVSCYVDQPWGTDFYSKYTLYNERYNQVNKMVNVNNFYIDKYTSEKYNIPMDTYRVFRVKTEHRNEGKAWEGYFRFLPRNFGSCNRPDLLNLANVEKMLDIYQMATWFMVVNLAHQLSLTEKYRASQQQDDTQEPCCSEPSS